MKVYDPSLPTTRFFIEQIELFMPVLAWLSESKTLRENILKPVSTLKGVYKAEADGAVYVVYIFVNGEVPGIQGITRTQTAELAEILAHLHDAGETVPFETPGLVEDISLPFCDYLTRFLSKADIKHSELFYIVSSYADMLNAAIRDALYLRDILRTGYSPLVLCHGDAHGNNVIQSERLVLSDWEDLRWAPVEADLFIHAWHPHGETLLETYAAARSSYHVNHELLFFYTLRRRIEDVWFDIQRLTEESPNEAEKAKLLNWTRQGIEEIQKLYESKQ